MIDIYLLYTQLNHDDDVLAATARRVFEERAEHVWPPEIVVRPGWRETLNEIVSRNELAISADEVIDGVGRLAKKIAKI